MEKLKVKSPNKAQAFLIKTIGVDKFIKERERQQEEKKEILGEWGDFGIKEYKV